MTLTRAKPLPYAVMGDDKVMRIFTPGGKLIKAYTEDQLGNALLVAYRICDDGCDCNCCIVRDEYKASKERAKAF